jgi:hypothetical protein
MSQFMFVLLCTLVPLAVAIGLFDLFLLTKRGKRWLNKE